MNPIAEADILAALSITPEDFWDVEDDACDCTFQRVGMWTNPYIGETLEVRMCCIWEELYKLFPQHVRRTDAFLDYRTNEWSPGQWEWDGETDMPRAIWYRQMAKREGLSLDEIRAKYSDAEAPQGIPREPQEPQPAIVEILWQAIQGLADEIAELKAAQS